MKDVAVGAAPLGLDLPERWGAPQRPGGLWALACGGEWWAGCRACASSPNNGMKLTPTVGALNRIVRGGGMERMIESSLGRSLSRGR